MPADSVSEEIAYGELRRIGAAEVSFHPAGRVFGSAEIRIAQRCRALVVSGDYQLAADLTPRAIRIRGCVTLVTESTVGLRSSAGRTPVETLAAILAWWDVNRVDGRASVLFAYGPGTAQRSLAGLAQTAGGLPGPVWVHGVIDRINAAHRAAGVAFRGPPAHGTQ